MEHHIMHVFNEDVNKRTKKMCNGKVSDSSSMTTYINILSLHQYDSLIWDIQHAHSPFIIMLFRYNYIDIVIIAEYILMGIESQFNIFIIPIKDILIFDDYGMVIFSQEI